MKVHINYLKTSKNSVSYLIMIEMMIKVRNILLPIVLLAIQIRAYRITSFKQRKAKTKKEYQIKF